MSITHPAEARNGLADYIVDQLNSGFIMFQTAASAEVAKCTFGNPAFGAASAGVATANAITSDTNAAGGTITKGELQTSASAAKVLFDVADITISSAIISATDQVGVSSCTYAASV